MSETSETDELDMPFEPDKRPGLVRRNLPGCLAVLVAFVVVAGGLYFAVTRGVDALTGVFEGGAEDYQGPGSGQVVFEVAEGDTIAEMGRNLKDEGVVASVQAFIDAAQDNPLSRGIQVGFYDLQLEMRAADVVEELVDPANLVTSKVTVPEGLPVRDIVKILGKNTDFSAKRFRNALKDTEALGLPEYAGGDPEGYLFPSTYSFGPKETPKTILAAMVTRFRQAAESAGIEEAADRLGYTPGELVTIASLVEAEGRGEDMSKIARVIYNRLETEGEPTYGKLEIDATVNYALGRNLGVAISQEDLEVDSPYNTRRYPGLPPGPIEAPGDDALEAAANPAEGPWFFYVTVDLATGETKFAEDYDEFLRYKQELQTYCETSDAC